MSRDAFSVLDSTDLTAFHRRVTVLSAAGMFLDGYDITVIAVALPTVTKQWHLSSLMSGALTASAVIGMFVGALVFGRLTDRLGRKKMYLVNLIGFVAFAVLAAFTQDAWQLLVCRFLLGLALGADYTISTSLLAEYAPARRRGSLMCRLGATWFVGAACTYLFALLLLPLGEYTWRAMLLLGAIFALIVLWMRRSIPESPRWLAARGHTDRARAVLTELGDTATAATIADNAAAQHNSPWRTLLTLPLLRMTLFCCGFWFMYTLAYYGITLYTPTILKQVTTSTAGSYTGSLIIALVGVAGAFTGVALVDRVGRRPLLITGFAGMLTALTILALLGSPGLAALVILLGIAVLFANSGPGIVNLVYPSEVFPTAVRATANGLGTAVSRIGAITGTLLLPTLINAWGLHNVLWIFVAAGAIGLTIAITLAPETKGRTLEELTETHTAAPEKVVG
ncbi:MFS transporter [Nocardia arthritidis]|uniref:MFS transporter n=1 Tax=Nocardia arthritidis TaxID=228602 RepID=A0A6G9YIT4_9NOCA|nr:MFS transporter [Nocardia arthritidis]QIS12946.1 MFS transporter [Nocardia arthritidis]